MLQTPAQGTWELLAASLGSSAFLQDGPRYSAHGLQAAWPFILSAASCSFSWGSPGPSFGTSALAHLQVQTQQTDSANSGQRATIATCATAREKTQKSWDTSLASVFTWSTTESLAWSQRRWLCWVRHTNAALGKVFATQCNSLYQQPVFYCFLFALAATEASRALHSSATKLIRGTCEQLAADLKYLSSSKAVPRIRM